MPDSDAGHAAALDASLLEELTPSMRTVVPIDAEPPTVHPDESVSVVATAGIEGALQTDSGTVTCSVEAAVPAVASKENAGIV
jgi:hypothetical protein